MVLVIAAALPGGHAVVVHGDQKLGVPLQPDHGELAQSHIQPAAVGLKGQLAVEAGADAGGDLGEVVLRAASTGGRRTGAAGRTAGSLAGVGEF